MQPIATDGVVWSACLFVCLLVCKMAQSTEMLFRGPNEPYIRWWSRSPMGRGSFRGCHGTEKHVESTTVYSAKGIIQSLVRA